jgi:putative hemolysin
VAPVIPGSTPIREVNVAYGLELDERDYTTIGGFLFGAIGRLPKPGDQVAVKGAVFEIVDMEGRRVASVRVQRRGPGAED